MHHADKEVRKNVALAVRGRLPEELADLLRDFTFEAEGLPVEMARRGFLRTK